MPKLGWQSFAIVESQFSERCKIKFKKKLTSVSFMYVCVAENGEMLVFFFVFFPNNSLIDNSLSE